MAKPREHLSNAPIAEAILDIRVQPRGDIDEHTGEALAKELQAGYPSSVQVFRWEALVGPNAMQQAQAPNGWLLRSSDGSATAQFRHDGFTFNKLRPYTSWSAVFEEMWRLWARYVDVFRPTEVSRLAVRYLNRLDLPPGGLDAVLVSPQALPPPLPAAARSLSRAEVPYPERSQTAIITVAAAMTPQEKAAIILDIDVFTTGAWPASAELRDEFEQLRRTKNEIFFAYLTEQAVEQHL
jgi:uncharacterized protein (TIGR04255 family)